MMSEGTDKTTLSATVAELKAAVEVWQQSKFFQDLQTWKAEWYRVNGGPGDETKGAEL